MVPLTTRSVLHALLRGVFDTLVVAIGDRYQRFFEIALALPVCSGRVQTPVTRRLLAGCCRYQLGSRKALLIK